MGMNYVEKKIGKVLEQKGESLCRPGRLVEIGEIESLLGFPSRSKELEVQWRRLGLQQN